MYHYTYKITNLINNKIYYGVRSCECLSEDDTKYMGSGTVIKLAINKYGNENFKKEIDKNFETREEANLYEAEIVNEEFIAQKDTYNLKIGGLSGCGYIHTEETKIKIGKASLGNSYATGYNHTEESIMKIGQASLGNSYATGYNHTEEAKMKISESTKGKNNPFYGKKHSEESIRKMSNCKCKYDYIITTPSGDEIVTNNLKRFCSENNLDDGHMYKVLRGKRKHHKKYTVKFYK